MVHEAADSLEAIFVAAGVGVVAEAGETIVEIAAEIGNPTRETGLHIFGMRGVESESASGGRTGTESGTLFEAEDRRRPREEVVRPPPGSSETRGICPSGSTQSTYGEVLETAHCLQAHRLLILCLPPPLSEADSLPLVADGAEGVAIGIAQDVGGQVYTTTATATPLGAVPRKDDGRVTATNATAEIDTWTHPEICVTSAILEIERGISFPERSSVRRTSLQPLQRTFPLPPWHRRRRLSVPCLVDSLQRARLRLSEAKPLRRDHAPSPRLSSN